MAAAVLVVVVAAVAVVLLPGGGGYRVTATFQTASQLVKGDLVQVAGRPVGVVKAIELTDDGRADVDLEIREEGYAPLRAGTQATVRQASLSGVANRYVDLRLPGEDAAGRDIPDGGRLPAIATSSAVDLDELFDTFDPPTRRALGEVLEGFATSYEGQGAAANAGWRYLDPSLAASSRLLEALDRDRPALRRFVTRSADLVTDVAAKRNALAELVTGLQRTTTAIASRPGALGDAVGRLPAFLRRANTTFVNLRAALDDLDPLVRESKPVARELRPLLAELRPFAAGARPTLRDLSALLRRDGAENDLVELTRLAVPLRDRATATTQRNGAARLGALPASTKALRKAAPEFATARPYAPELTAWFDDFSHSGAYDAVGGASRASANVNLFAAVDGVLQPIPPELREAVFKATAQLGQRARCPGALERGTVWKPTPDFPCDPTQVPVGK